MTQTVLTAALFGDPQIEALFSDADLVAAMVQVEAALAQVQADLGLIGPAAARELGQGDLAARLDLSVLAAGTGQAGVPVPALVAELRRLLSPEAAEGLHYGATSQDIVDTAMMLTLKRTLDVCEDRLARLLDRLRDQSDAHAATPMLARTRGQLATPITLGLRLANWAQPLIGLEAALPGLRTTALKVQFGGASGSQSAVAPFGAAISEGLAARLGLADAPPWHTDRSAISAVSSWLAQLVAGLAKIGADLALASRGEIGEMRAGTAGGSSTMPHKANPVTAEALQSLNLLSVGLQAGLSASLVQAEDRDGRAWPVEWVLLPQLCVATGAALRHAEGLIGSLQVDAPRMKARIEQTPAVMAEAVVFALAPHLGRSAANALVKDALQADKGFWAVLKAAEPERVDWAALRRLDTDLAAAEAVRQRVWAGRARQAASARS